MPMNAAQKRTMEAVELWSKPLKLPDSNGFGQHGNFPHSPSPGLPWATLCQEGFRVRPAVSPGFGGGDPWNSVRGDLQFEGYAIWGSLSSPR